MSRTTQFIGLTYACKERVKDCTIVYEKGWETWGMFNEDIPLAKYVDQDGKLVAIEFVQATAWSSGPMIFTGLLTAHGPVPENWREDVSMRELEFDYEKGLYYV